MAHAEAGRSYCESVMPARRQRNGSLPPRAAIPRRKRPVSRVSLVHRHFYAKYGEEIYLTTSMAFARSAGADIISMPRQPTWARRARIYQ